MRFDSVKIKKYGLKALWSLFRMIIIAGICFVILYPLFTKIMFGVMDVADVYDGTIKYIPKHFTTDHLREAMKILEFPGSLYNTLIIVSLVSLIHVASGTLVAYGFARYQFRGQNFLFALLLFAMVIPPDLLMIPYYLMFRNFDFWGLGSLLFGEGLQLTDTVWPLALLGMTCTGLKNGLYVFIMRQHFRGIPRELEEAAYVDGAGVLRTLVSIILPSATSMLVTVFLFSFVWQWLDATFTPVLCANMSILPSTLSSLSNPLIFLNDSGGNAWLTASLVKNAGVILAIFPLLLLYLIMQKFFVQSVERSGIVG